MTIVNVVNSYASIQADLVRVPSKSDAYLPLRTEAVGDRLLRLLKAAEVRGAEFGTGKIVGFDVEPMLGMKITPVSEVIV